MSAVYLGVILVPLLALVWNLVPAERRARIRPARRLAALPAATGRALRRAATAPARGWAALRRRSARTAGLGLPPDVPRSPSVAGWQPAPGYSAVPVAEAEEQTAQVA